MQNTVMGHMKLLSGLIQCAIAVVRFGLPPVRCSIFNPEDNKAKTGAWKIQIYLEKLTVKLA